MLVSAVSLGYAVQEHNLVTPRAWQTKSDTSGHCLLAIDFAVLLIVYWNSTSGRGTTFVLEIRG